MKTKILIVEDQFAEANNLQMIVEQAGYYVCGIARSVQIALRLIEEEKPDLALLDIKLQGHQTGIDLAQILREKNIGFIYLSANSDKETLEQAKATYPYGFLVKPFRKKDVLVALEIAHFHQKHNQELNDRSQSREKQLTDQAFSSPDNSHLKNIIGKSPQHQQVLNFIQIVAPTETSVLILGESGTGKERVAECVQLLSARNKKTFVKINCATLPAGLIESELFGHERGSFTGATEKRIGKFEQAEGGTIFLDEIGEMPLDLQVKLLRVLQEREIERVGGSKTIQIDVRIIAATNKNLEKEVAEGRFRIDLYYRLNVFPITVPPLRERKEDIVLLANHFLNMYSKKFKKEIAGLSEKVFKELKAYDWPGNIRELEHVIERGVLLSNTSVIQEISLPNSKNLGLIDSEDADVIKTIEENERDHILKALKKTNGKVSGSGGAAELLGVPSSTLNSKIKKLGIKKSYFKP